MDSPTEEKQTIQHVEVADADLKTDEWSQIKQDAAKAEEFEKSLGFWQSIKIYKTAVFWSMVASATIIMEGYDTAAIGAFNALPVFREYYGNYYPAIEQYQLSASWQSALGLAGSVGSIIGIYWGEFLCTRYGYRRTLIGNLILIIPLIAITTFSTDVRMLLAGEIVCGIPFGAFATLPIAYASEICPISLRGYLTTFINLCWVIGQTISQGIVNGYSVNEPSTWAFRLPWAIQWAWPVPLLVAIFFAPESPWWLVRQGRLVEAEHSVRRLAATKDASKATETVAMMVRTNQLEIDTTQGASYLDCFRQSDRRRTEISCLTFGCQVTCGLYFAAQSTYFFEQAGLDPSSAYKMGLGNQAVAMVGNIAAWFLIRRFGRRTLYLFGMGAMTTTMFIIAILACFANKSSAIMWGQGGAMFCWVAFYVISVGPLAFAIVGETSSTRLRNKTVALARNTYNVLAIIATVIIPYQLNPTAWNWAGKTGFFWGPISFLSLVWVFFRLPETKGRSYYELDILFERNTPTRQFASTVVEPQADEHQRESKGH